MWGNGEREEGGIYTQCPALSLSPGCQLRLPHPSLSDHPINIVRLISLDDKLHLATPLLKTLKTPDPLQDKIQTAEPNTEFLSRTLS